MSGLDDAGVGHAAPAHAAGGRPRLYEEFFGLSAPPFSLLPDSDFLFLSKRHRAAINMLEFGTLTQAGFIVITGEVGTGKTTIIRRYLRSVGPDVTVGVITNSGKAFGKLLNWIAMAFELDCRGRDQARLYTRFVDFLLENYARGKRTLLIVDEAQNFKADTLEELRMLSNVNNEKDQLLQIVLAGQPELLETLRKPELRQFVQRIAVHCNLDPLAPRETARYIRHRLGVVGGAPELFDDAACAGIHFFSGGTPRLINQLCDLAMVYAFAEAKSRIDLDLVVDAVQDRNRSGLSPFRTVLDGPLGEDTAAAIEAFRCQMAG